jgi:amidohydrolase
VTTAGGAPYDGLHESGWDDANTDVVALRRDLHAHPEICFAETRTTELIVGHLRSLGLQPSVLPSGTGAICDIGSDGPMIALRADIDALALLDTKDVPYRSTVAGLAHACGHDAHTAILLVAAQQLCRRQLPGRIRLIFQPGEETVPGGALKVLEAGALDGVRQIYALHCDPRIDVGQIGVRAGAITAACDSLDVRLDGPGGHTSRPQLTVDLVYALGRLVTDLPGMLSRRVDPRSGLSLVWGAIQAGHATNAVPSTGTVTGTVRILDRDAWDDAEKIVRTLVDQIVVPTGATADVNYVRGVPPCVNNANCVEVQRRAIVTALGADAVTTTQQSMGGEDFAWYLEQLRGALARLGVHTPGQERQDIHQSAFDIDERALGIGVRYTVQLAVDAVSALAAAG